MRPLSVFTAAIKRHRDGFDKAMVTKKLPFSLCLSSWHVSEVRFGREPLASGPTAPYTTTVELNSEMKSLNGIATLAAPSRP